jgi:excinuclease UvrABC ATPase subunit
MLQSILKSSTNMTLIKCEKCKGEGYIKSTDILADEDDQIICPECEGVGYVEKMPF